MADPRPPDTNSTFIFSAEELKMFSEEAGTTIDRTSCPRCLKTRPHLHRQNNCARCLSACFFCNKDVHRGTYCSLFTTTYKDSLGESFLEKAWPEYQTPTTHPQLVKAEKEERARFESAKIQEQKESKAKDSHHFRQDTRRSDSRDYKPKDGFSHRSYDMRPSPGPYERGSSRQTLYHNREENPLRPRYQDREEPWYQTAGRYPDEYLRQPYDQYAGQSHRPAPGPYDDRFQRPVNQYQTRYPAYSQGRLHSPPVRRPSSYMDEAPHRYEHRSYTGHGRRDRRSASPEDRSKQTCDRLPIRQRPSLPSNIPRQRFQMADKPDLDSSAVGARLIQIRQLRIKDQTEKFEEAKKTSSAKKDDVDMTGKTPQDQGQETIRSLKEQLVERDQQIQHLKQQLDSAQQQQHERSRYIKREPE